MDIHPYILTEGAEKLVKRKTIFHQVKALILQRC